MNTHKAKKVAVVGPESTGKTELSAFLAMFFHTRWVGEYARGYLDRLGRAYREKDLVCIARGQLEAEDALWPEAHGALICDTTPLVVQVWSQVKYGRCSAALSALVNRSTYDLHLLTYADIPWESDPQREHPTQRKEILALYQQALHQRGIAYTPIRGERAVRRATAIEAIARLLCEDHA